MSYNLKLIDFECSEDRDLPAEIYESGFIK